MKWKYISCFSDDEIDTSRIITKSNNSNTTNHNSGLDTLNDLDNEESALHEFDFLTGDAATSASINEMKTSGN
jgi:hypothetical protein